MLASPPVSSAPTRPSSAGPPMSERTAFGAAHATHGSRTNVSARCTVFIARDDLLLAARAREVVLARVAVVLARARERERLLAVEVVVAGAQPQRVAAVARPPLMRETTQPPV